MELSLFAIIVLLVVILYMQSEKFAKVDSEINAVKKKLDLLLERKNEESYIGPLSIDSIKSYTPKYYLITNLEQGMQYAIFYGDHTASFPEYDLSFSKYVSDSIPTLTPEYIEKLPVSQLTERSSWMPFLRTYGIWMVILFIILQILYIVRRLLKSPNR